MNEVIVKGTKYQIIRLLGHGKGGYSYLAKNNEELVVIKKIHHEPCDYYHFGNKMEAELRDYQVLKNKILIPLMIDYDLEQEIIVKEYIDGKTIDQLIIDDLMKEEYLNQVKKMCQILYKKNLNIDYYPTNFVVNNKGLLYYIDYECNQYSDEWNFENWGSKYWSKTIEFEKSFIKK